MGRCSAPGSVVGGWVGGWVGCGWEGNGEQLSPPGLCFSDGTVSLEARGIQTPSSG